jgi:type IV pilus assembly protein PilA
MQKKQIRGFSLIELLIVVAIILIIAAIAIPNLLRSRMSANRAAAVSTLRNIHNSQAVYILNYGNGQNYASSLAQLGPGTPCSASSACLVDSLIGCTAEPCAKSGYGFFLTSPAISTYVGAATPISWGGSGEDNFCSTDSGVIHRQLGATASLSAAPPRADCENPTLYAPIQ